MRRVNPDADILRVQDSPVYGASDLDVLEWAAKDGRILLMIGFANARLKAGQPMAGLFAVHDDAPFGQVIDDLLAVLGASEAHDWENKVEFLPF